MHQVQDGSGAISSKELLGVMRAMGQNPTEDELLNLVMEVDLDGNGTIEFPEFLEMMKSKAAEVDQESDLREAFKIFDRDRDGYIDMKELKKVKCVRQILALSNLQYTLYVYRAILSWFYIRHFFSGVLVSLDLDIHPDQVTTMLGQQLTKEEVEDFMREADVVSGIKLILLLVCLFGWFLLLYIDDFNAETNNDVSGIKLCVKVHDRDKIIEWTRSLLEESSIFHFRSIFYPHIFSCPEQLNR